MSSPNRSLTIAVIIDPPAVMPCALDENCPKRGIVYEIAELMCQKLNFNCTFVPANTTVYGSSENGTWTGVVGQITSGLVDTSLPRFTPTEQRSEVIDFSSSYFFEEFLLVTRQPEINMYENKLDLIHAFDLSVWFGIAAILILAACIMSDTIMFKIKLSVFEQYVITRLHPAIKFCGKYITICIISLVALTLSRAYTGYLFTKHVGSNMQKPFTDIASFAECVQTKTCTLSVTNGLISYIDQLVNVNGTSDFSRLNKALKKNPLLSFELDELIDRILIDKSTYNTALIWDTDFYYGASEYDACRFYVVRAALLPGPNTFPLPKEWPYRRELDLLANEFNEFGLIREIMNKYRVVEQKPCRQLMSTEGDSLSFLVDLFMFLFIGEGLCVACFCAELLINRII